MALNNQDIPDEPQTGEALSEAELTYREMGEAVQRLTAMVTTLLERPSRSVPATVLPPQTPLVLPTPSSHPDQHDPQSQAHPPFYPVEEARASLAVEPRAISPPADSIREELESLKKEFKKFQSPTLVGAIPVKDLCYYPGGQLPDNFRLPEFNKYDGKSCPRTHLKIYCNDMFEVCNNERLMIQMFHKSLVGDALHWFSSLDLTQIKTWDDFSQVFLQHFKFNLELLPKKADLEMMSQKSRESILEYAYRWRQSASRLQSPPAESELVSMFIKTLGPTYQKMLIAQIFPDFATLTMSASQIERGIKEGIIIDHGSAQASSSNSRASQNKSNEERKREVHMVSPQAQQQQFLPTQPSMPVVQHFQQPYPQRQPVHPPPAPPRYPAPQWQPRQNFRPVQTQQYQQPQPPQRRVFTPLPQPLSTLLPMLLERKDIVLPASRPIPNPLPPTFNMGENCAYHQGPGHSTDRCITLRHKVQDLIDFGKIVFGAPAVQSPESMGIQQNPLPAHAPPHSGQVNTLSPNAFYELHANIQSGSTSSTGNSTQAEDSFMLGMLE